MPDDAHDIVPQELSSDEYPVRWEEDYDPGLVRSWRQVLTAVAGALLAWGLIFALLALLGCSDATGPSDPALAPQFQKVYNAGEGSGGGGGGGASGAACEYPKHMTGDCPVKALEAGIGFGIMVGTCWSGFATACAGTAAYNGRQWNDYATTPDAGGIARDFAPGEWSGAPYYPIGGAGW